MSVPDRLKDIVTFWFSYPANEKWWDEDAQFDSEIQSKFMETYKMALEDDDFQYEATPELVLGHIILLDQLSRNMFRGDKLYIQTDVKALQLAKKVIESGWDKNMTKLEKLFAYMPFMHSENYEDQCTNVKLQQESEQSESDLKYAIEYREIIERFGRFPHRNKILGRTSTPEETDFLNA